MPQVRLAFGGETVELQVPAGKQVLPHRGAMPAAIPDVAAATRAAVEQPLEFPPLRRALTPEDHVAVVVREETSHLPDLLIPLFGVLQQAGVQPGQVTLVASPRLTAAPGPAWQAQLPAELQQAALEVHHPEERGKLAYLASTPSGRRVYLNRTIVDADQLVVVGRFGYDPVLGYGGGLGDLFPAYSDVETRQEFAAKISDIPPAGKPRPVWHEIDEVGWLLGMPFLLQVVEGPGDQVLSVLAGLNSAVTKEGKTRLDGAWRVTVPQAVDLVVTTLGGDPARQGFGDLTRAFANAARVVRPGGRIVLLSRTGGRGELGPSVDYLRQADNAPQALARIRHDKLPDAASAWELVRAVSQAQLYLLSAIPQETAEELFVTPLDHPGQVQKLIDEAESVLLLEDGHKTMATVR